MNYNRPLVRGSFLVAIGASIVIVMFAGRALAAGAYQRTDDRKKTIVWNNDPQPGDAAEWTGGRDPEGYADGAGTLTWLRAQKAFATGSNVWGTKKVPISRLTGTMVHGKFVGAVTTIDHGKTYHAKYVDGQRKGNWSLGPVIAKATSVESTAEPEEPKQAQKIATAKKVETPAEPKVSEAEPEPPTEGPDDAKPEVTSQKSAVSKTTAPESADPSTLNSQPKTPLIAQASTEADESATPRQQPVTRKSALAPGAVRAIDQPARTVAKKTEKPKETSEKIRKATKVEERKPESSEERVESPAEGPLEKANAQRPTLNAQHPTSEVPHPPSLNPQPLLEDTPADDSIRTLTGPPSSLRKKPAPAPPAATTPEPAIAPVSAPSAEPKLNAVQAMDISDIEARTKGYDLGEYQLPKAEYNPADDTWSVSYIGREGDKNAKHLRVTIQDKSGKAEVGK
jgi:hypothetical protein